MSEMKRFRSLKSAVKGRGEGKAPTLNSGSAGGDVAGGMKAVDPMVILAVIILIAAIATYLIPAGSFDRVPVEGQDYDKIDINSFKYTEQNPIGIFDIFKSFTLGLQGAGDIIFFLLIIGGMFQVVEATGALHSGLSNLVIKTRGAEMVLIPICVFLFSLISATAACCEEYLAFLPLMYVVCVAIGFDSLVAVALLFGSSAVGYAGGMMNPFTVLVAQNIAGLKPLSGIEYRWIVWVILATATSIFIMIYANKIRKNPEKSSMRSLDEKYAESLDVDSIQPISGSNIAVLVIFVLTFVVVAFTILKFGFYVDEMSGIFIISMILVAIVSKMRPSDVAGHFVTGAKNMLWAGLIIGMCKGVTNIMSDAGVMDTLIYGMGNILKGVPQGISASGMFVLQDLLNFLIPSGSGQAAVTMPFMAPLSDVLGLNRQVAVLAFQLGDAFTNVIAPTSGELMAALAICHISWKKWFKFWGPMWGIWCVIAIIMLTIAVAIGYK